MKKIVVATTQRKYYVANVGGMLVIIGLLTWFLILAIHDGGIDFTSVFFWLSLPLLILLPFSAISFFSSMKTVEVTSNGLTISYIFQKHTNVVRFSEIKAVKIDGKENKVAFRETFSIILGDGRVFEFERSQFDRYEQLKEVCLKSGRQSPKR